MHVRSIVAVVTFAATISLPAVVSAAPVAVPTPMHAYFGKPHKISLSLRNDGQQPLTVKAGDQELTLAPGKATAVKMLEGDKVVAETASPDHAVGAVLVVISSNLADATIAIK